MAKLSKNDEDLTSDPPPLSLASKVVSKEPPLDLAVLISVLTCPAETQVFIKEKMEIHAANK